MIIRLSEQKGEPNATRKDLMKVTEKEIVEKINEIIDELNYLVKNE